MELPFPKSKRVVNPYLLQVVRELPCVACSPGRQVSETEPHHVTTRGAGGGDEVQNLMPLCREHHTEWHLGFVKMVRKYPSVRYWLENAMREDILEKVGPLIRE